MCTYTCSCMYTVMRLLACLPPTNIMLCRVFFFPVETNTILISVDQFQMTQVHHIHVCTCTCTCMCIHCTYMYMYMHVCIIFAKKYMYNVYRIDISPPIPYLRISLIHHKHPSINQPLHHSYCTYTVCQEVFISFRPLSHRL